MKIDKYWKPDSLEFFTACLHYAAQGCDDSHLRRWWLMPS